MAELTQQQYNQLKSSGWNDEKITTMASERGYSLPGQGGVSGLGGVGVGIAKGAIGIARGTAQVLQGTGQRIISAVSGEPLSKVRQTTGIESLDPTKKSGAAVTEMLRPKGGAEKTGAVVANVASFFIPTSGAIGAVGKVVSPVGKQVYKTAIGISAKEAPLVQAYRARVSLGERIVQAISGKETGPITNAETAIRNNLFGFKTNIGVQAKRALTKIWDDVVGPALKKSKEVVSFPKFIDDIEQQISKVADPSRKRQLTKALDSFKDDFSDVKDINLEQLQKFKEGWTKFLPQKAFKGEDISQSFREIQNIASQIARNRIYKVLGDDVRAAYFDYGNLKNLMIMGQRTMTDTGLKGGTGTLLSELASRVITPIATGGGLTLYKVGKGMEFIGRPGLKVLGEIFGLSRKTIK